MTHPQQPATQDGNSLLVQVLDSYLAARAAGTAPPVEELIAQHPELAGELRECLASLEMIKVCSLKKESASGHGPDVPAQEGEARTGILGDYRILREIGRGGMGVVYEAWQISLGRRVALKVLPFAATLDQRHLQRFKNEAQAAAQLHHSHIVPVFAVGEERGVHYYAMQFIDGRTLAAVIDELRRGPDPSPLAVTKIGPDDPQRTAPYLTPKAEPSTIQAQANVTTERSHKTGRFFRDAAKLGFQAAEALEHAHSLGVVHRDIKPANLLVDARSHLWVTDFGLAQFGRDANLTVTGDLLGTLRYMSPEQARAKKAVIDHRTDIYSLGATLYELLTLQPVFDGQDRQTILNQVLNDEPVAPRKHNKAIPVELELIVLKALSKNPEERYGTALELGEDLKRFLEDKPILARRPTLLQFVGKWARRHQAVVAAGVGFVVVALGATSISTVLIWQEKNEAQAQRDEAENQRRIADAERGVAVRLRKEADAQRLLAQRALEELFADSSSFAATTPDQDKFRKEFLQKSLAYFEEAARRDPGTDPEGRLSKGTALRRQGDIQQQLGMRNAAETAFRQSVEVLNHLVSEHPDNSEFKFDLVSSRLKLGNLLKSTGRAEEAEKVFGEARGLSRQLVAASPEKEVFASLHEVCIQQCEEQRSHPRFARNPVRAGIFDEMLYERANLPNLTSPLRTASRPPSQMVGQVRVQAEPLVMKMADSFQAVPSEVPPGAAFLDQLRKKSESAIRVATPQPPSPPMPYPQNPNVSPNIGPYGFPVPDARPTALYMAQTHTAPMSTQWNAYSSASVTVNNYFFAQPLAGTAEVQAAQATHLNMADLDAAKVFVLTGEALNAVVERIQKKQTAGAKGPDMVLDAEAAKKLNVTSPELQGVQVLRFVQQGQDLPWPNALQDECVKELRMRFGVRVKDAVTEVKDKKSTNPKLGDELKESLDKMNRDVNARVNDLEFSDYTKAKQFLRQMDNAVKALDSAALSDDQLAQTLAQKKSIAELVKYLGEKKLRVAPASPNDENVYKQLYQALLAYEALMKE